MIRYGYIISLDNNNNTNNNNNAFKSEEIERKHTPVSKEYKNLLDKIHLSGMQDEKDEIEDLLEKVNVNAQYSELNNVTPMHKAAIFGSEEAVKLILQKGANPKLKSDNETPSEWARKNNREDIADIIDNNSEKLSNKQIELLVRAFTDLTRFKALASGDINFTSIPHFIIEHGTLCRALAIDELIEVMDILLNVKDNARLEKIENLLINREFAFYLDPKKILEIFEFFKESPFFIKNKTKLAALEDKYKFNLIELIKKSPSNITLFCKKNYGELLSAVDRLDLVNKIYQLIDFENKKLQQLISETIYEIINISGFIDEGHKKQYLLILYKALDLLPLSEVDIIGAGEFILQHDLDTYKPIIENLFERKNYYEKILVKIESFEILVLKKELLACFGDKRLFEYIYTNKAINLLPIVFSDKERRLLFEDEKLYEILSKDKDNDLLYQPIKGLKFRKLELNNLCIAVYCSLDSVKFAKLFLDLGKSDDCKLDGPSIFKIINIHLDSRNSYSSDFKSFIITQQRLLQRAYKEVTTNINNPVGLTDVMMELFSSLNIEPSPIAPRKSSLADKFPFFKTKKQEEQLPTDPHLLNLPEKQKYLELFQMKEEDIDFTLKP